ncbi:MAG TPA: NAD-dependent epimerase/dehydratase family protein [Patescibacteria group bacterium]|nr:NAD-dependent epimerase/dehydratase family protein [Patescibacteria group bacterium]
MNRQIALVTGANGFIGSNLVKKLIHKNYEVHVIIKKESSIKRIQEFRNQIKIHINDLTNEDTLRILSKKINPTVIFHLATYENYRDQDKINEMINTNIIGTKNLLLATKDIEYNCFINTGSSSEYGVKNMPMKETDTISPISFYAATKASATHIASSFAKQYSKNVITFRLFSVYGPGENNDRFIPNIVTSLKNDLPVFLTKGTVRHDFIYVDDVVDAYLKAAKLKHKPGDIYNIGTGRQYTNEQVLKTLEKVARKKISVVKKTFTPRLWDTNFWVANNLKAKNKLGWKPKTNLEDGLKKTYTHFVKINV